MGEYAKYKGERIKIGTCEDMYYLRADQRHLVEHLTGNVDPVKGAGEIRFRFPFPVEDDIPPGGFEDAFKTLGIYGADELLAGGLDHSTLQFTRNYPQSGGIILSTPCPRSAEGQASGLKFAYNGYSGSVHIVQQRLIGEELWTVCQCGDCGAKFRLPFEDAEKLAVVLRKNADQDQISNSSRAEYYHKVADRVLAGYAHSVGKVAQ